MDTFWPIWRDYYVDFGNNESVEYSIYCGGTAIYRGIAHMRPGQSTNRIRINDVCADYLVNVFLGLSSDGSAGGMTAPYFQVYSSNPIEDESDILVAEVQFINDWSYEFDHDTTVASAPIDGVVDVRQPIIYSTYIGENVRAELTFDDGTSVSVVLSLARSADFSEDFNDDFAKSIGGSSAGSVVINPSDWEGLHSVTIGQTVYRVVRSCNRYALYYANAYGGWDTFLIRNIVKRNDAYKRHEHLRDYDNSVQMNRGRYNYLTEVTPSWSLSTHYLNDDESLRMAHLIGTNAAFLYDMEKGELWPVNVTDSSVAYLTAKNNNRMFPTYTINIELARLRMRR